MTRVRTQPETVMRTYPRTTGHNLMVELVLLMLVLVTTAAMWMHRSWSKMTVMMRRREVLALGWRTLPKVMLINRDGQLNACNVA